MATTTYRKTWRYEDLFDLPDDGKRYEIIDGALFEMPAPNRDHATAIINLIALLLPTVRALGGQIFTAPFDVFMPGADPVQPDIMVVGAAANGAEALEAALQHRPDVVLMDFRLPDSSGAEVAKAIRQAQPDIAIVNLSADGSPGALLAAIEAGARGYLLKSEAASELVAGIRLAAQGDMLIPAEALSDLVSRLGEMTQRESERRRLRAGITPRELEVLHLMASGLDNHAIAERLTISFATVRGHVQSILEKLGAHSKLEAVARAAEYDLLAS
jgi:DNA-binding NarL/FixJ family response regulator